MLTFLTRYTNIVLIPFGATDFSLYILAMKIAFITIHVLLLYFVYKKYRATKADENFRIEFLIGLSAILGVLTAPSYNLFSILEMFSLALEACAMVPQLYLLYSQKNSQASAITTHYIFISGNFISVWCSNNKYLYFSIVNVHFHCNFRKICKKL